MAVEGQKTVFKKNLDGNSGLTIWCQFEVFLNISLTCYFSLESLQNPQMKDFETWEYENIFINFFTFVIPKRDLEDFQDFLEYWAANQQLPCH